MAVIAHWLATHHQYSVNEGDALVLRTATDADEYRAAGWKVEGPFVLQDDGGAVDLLRDVANSAPEFDDARMGYLVVQIDRVTWDELATYRGQ